MEDIRSMMSIGKSDFGIPGYFVAKTPHYIKRSAVISPDKQKGQTKAEKQQASLPDPTKYAPDFQKLHQKYWNKASGRFLKSKKINYLEEQTLRSKSNPGPGTYLKSDPKKDDMSKGSPLGRFDKSERLSFLTTVESYAEETPSCWKYATTASPAVHSVKWIKPKIKEKVGKAEVGPGKYSEGVNKALLKTMASNPKYTFPKAKTPTSASARAFSTPGVGAYKETDKAFIKHVATKVKAAVIFPYKIKSFIETITKNSSKTPGPGSYNIMPPLTK